MSLSFPLKTLKQHICIYNWSGKAGKVIHCKVHDTSSSQSISAFVQFPAGTPPPTEAVCGRVESTERPEGSHTHSRDSTLLPCSSLEEQISSSTGQLLGDLSNTAEWEYYSE